MFSDRLKSLRKEKNLTQKGLGQILNISGGTVGMYEIGKRNPDNDTLNKIADFFNVSTDYLLGRTNDTTPVKSSEKITYPESKGLELMINDPAIVNLLEDYPSWPEEEKENLLRFLYGQKVLRTIKKEK